MSENLVGKSPPFETSRKIRFNFKKRSSYLSYDMSMDIP